MLGEISLQVREAYEEYLDAKKAYEDWRDGYMPYVDDKAEYERTLEELMLAMDYAEDWYDLSRREYDDVLSMERQGASAPEDKRKFPKQSIKDMFEHAAEAKRQYDDLAEGRIQFAGGSDSLARELERLRHRWYAALDEYNSAYGGHVLEEKRREISKSDK